MGSYFGSKATSGLCQPIIALMPPHDTYIETHLGGGAIMKRKPPALHNIGIDLNPRALAAFECDYPVKKVNDCAHRFLAEYDYGGRELIYSDPPYLHHTRTSGRRYRFDYEEQDHIDKRVFGLVIDFGTSQSPKSTRPLTTYWCPSRPGHQALRNNFASSLLLRTCLPMTGRRVWMPTLLPLWRYAHDG